MLRAVAAALLVVCALTVTPVRAQAPVVGFVGLSSPEQEVRAWTAFRDGLRDLGYEEGRTLTVEARWAGGDNARFPALAHDLISRRPAVIVSPCGPALAAIRAASSSVPIVSACADSNNFLGEVATMNRPGARTTGFTFLAPESAGKRLQILKQLRPRLSRVGVVYSRQLEEWPTYWDVMNRVVPQLGITLVKIPIERSADLEPAIETAIRQGAEAFIVFPDATTFGAADRIAALMVRHRLPSGFDLYGFVAAGGLFSYGADTRHLYRSVAAGYVDRIVKGAAPGELPIQQPTRFSLIFNLKTARAIGLQLPPALLAQADEILGQ